MEKTESITKKSYSQELNGLEAINSLPGITEQIIAPKSFGEGELLFRNLIQKLPAAFYTTDKDGYINFYNDAAVEFWGRKPEIGKDMWCGSLKIFELDGLTEVPLDKCPMALTLKEKRKIISNESYIVERPDGTRKYFIPYPEPIFDPDGSMTGASNMLMDVTESKFAEEHSARLAAIVHSSGDAIISKTLNSVITSWNEAAEKIFGYNADEMIGQPILKIIPVDRINEEDIILQKIRKGELINHFQTKRLTKEGKLIDISLTISPIKDRRGKITGASKIVRDITEQKESEKIIQEKEEHLRMAIESAKLGTWEYDPTSFKLKCSAESRRMCGLPENFSPGFQLIAKHVYEKDKDLFYQQIKDAIDPGKDGKFDMQLRIHRYDDNEIRWIRAQGIVFFNPDKQPERLIGTMLDVTEEKQREQELMDSMEMFQIMTDNVPAMIWMSGTDKFSDYFNRTWLEFTGRTLDQEEYEGWIDGVHPDDIQKCIDTYSESLKEQKGFYTEYRLRRHDGEYRWLADNAVPRFSPDGEFLGFISACIDIDDQKRFSEKILASELLFKTISNTSPVGLWMTDSEGQTTFVNDTWIEWTGFPIEKHSGFGWTENLIEEDKANARSRFCDAFKKREKYNSEFRITGKNGEHRWCFSEGFPYYRANGELAGYAGSVTDISDIKKLEHRKDDFIKMASHELKTPITSINGYVQLLLTIYNEQGESKWQISKNVVKSSLQTIAKQVSKLTRLITELLDLSKIESGKLELNESAFDLEEMVEEVVQEIRHTTSRHALIFRSDFEGKITADRDRIGQAMVNILNNAIKYSPDSDKVEVYLERKNNTAVIRVKDYGIGIDKKDHQKIFERFYRVEGKDEQTFPGFGIGLFITNEIIQRHHGTLAVESEKNKYTVFTVTLPLNSSKKTE